MKQWRKTIEKVGGRGTEFNNINFFIIPFTTSSCVPKVPCTRTQKSEKLAQIRNHAEHLLLGQSVAREYIFGQEVRSRKYKVWFCPQIA